MKCTRARLHPFASLAGAFKLLGLRRRSSEFQIIVRRRAGNSVVFRQRIINFAPILLRGFDCLNYFISSITFTSRYSTMSFASLFLMIPSSVSQNSRRWKTHQKKKRKWCNFNTRNEKHDHIGIYYTQQLCCEKNERLRKRDSRDVIFENGALMLKSRVRCELIVTVTFSFLNSLLFIHLGVYYIYPFRHCKDFPIFQYPIGIMNNL